MFTLENIDLVIFDLDGTLLNSLDQLVTALNRALADNGSAEVGSSAA
ncbi:MAG: HAD hydrolase-like protein [Bdellovibrionota bacterium]